MDFVVIVFVGLFACGGGGRWGSVRGGEANTIDV